MKKNKLFLFGIILISLILGVLIGRFIIVPGTAQKQPLYWIDPMEPQVHYSRPGKSHMGMELVPVFGDESKDTNETGISISPTVVNNLGVRTAQVVEGPLSRHIETVGYVTPNESEITHIHTYANGWIKKLCVKAVGDVVKSHQVVMQMYSPQLINAQEEFLIALDSHNKSLIDASYKKLQTFHISEEQIQQLKIKRQANQLIDIYSHQGGVVVDLNVREGMYVTPDTEMMNIVDLSNVWIIAEVFEEEANSVQIGESAVAILPAFPGTSWKGQVEYIYPQIDPITRTLKVRFLFSNPHTLLKPNMYATVSLNVNPKPKVLSIPIEALIRSSKEDRVIVSLGQGRFQVRQINVGIESDGRIEVLSGLKVGERVVTSGQFLIDSESNLQADLGRLNSKIEAQSQQEKTIQGHGVIQSIDLTKGVITLNHEAISELGWPAMSMNFLVSKEVNLQLLKVKDKVAFSLKKEGQQFVIINISKMN
ncbi:copper/silver efflux system, membrane fusion protein [Legionella moravica]|uniref:Copper/silver efflux system, membrane fusion protein n=1 Tax=Legionella moravica TaxID=39962 RepID=A0A378JY15_9GAMM|nr:efflux RND transporter periplasmic adaptor subunit [Legionella moravica]KTD30966.1 copper/silver efflux system, membrane fusion protein [Legionella moravica]STX63543.1 copper/silver efflux system, membrane fusion protein [Legionella moravica]